jgi:HEAT repeat protein
MIKNSQRMVAKALGLLVACLLLFDAMRATPWPVDSLLQKSAEGTDAERTRIEVRLVRVGRSAIPTLVAYLPDPRPDVRGAAGRALEQIDPRWEESDGARQAVPALCEHLHRTDEAEIIRAERVLMQIGPPARGAIPELLEQLLEGGQREVQSGALEAILAIDPRWASGTDGQRVVAQLLDQLEYLKHQNGLVLPGDPMETRVLRVLGLLGPAARPAVWPLIWELEHHDEEVRGAARDALDRIDPDWRDELIAEHRTQDALYRSSTHPEWWKNDLRRFRMEKLLDQTTPGWRDAWAAKIRDGRRGGP